MAVRIALDTERQAKEFRILANRKLKAFGKWTPAAWNDMPNLPGVYVISLCESPLYIGQAADLRRRFTAHQIDIKRINGCDFNGMPYEITVVYREVADTKERLDLEWDLVSTIKPPINRRLVSRRKKVS